jgi:chromosome segregation ATPase
MELEAESRFHELETKYINALEERDIALQQINQIKTERDTLANSIASYQASSEELQIQIVEFRNQNNRSKVEIQQYVQEKQDLVSLVEKRDAEISTIKGNIDSGLLLTCIKRKEIFQKKGHNNYKEIILNFKLNSTNSTVL